MSHPWLPPTLSRRWLLGGLLVSWLLALWLGAWHHGQHAGLAPPVNATTTASQTASSPGADGLDHDAGSQLCRLLDHLLLADALPIQPALSACSPAGLSLAPAPAPVSPPAATLRLYQARAPPRA